MVTKKDRNRIAVQHLSEVIKNLEYKIKENTIVINRLANENSWLKRQKAEFYVDMQNIKNERV